MTRIGKNKYISEDELIFKASRSSGPGGQNVNKVNSRITLFYDLANSENFSDEQKRLIAKRLAGRTDKNGVVRVVSQKHRTQKANRQATIERLQQSHCELVDTLAAGDGALARETLVRHSEEAMEWVRMNAKRLNRARRRKNGSVFVQPLLPIRTALSEVPPDEPL